MRRYFYLLMLLFSVSVSSQEINNEIVGKWEVIDVQQSFICGPGTKPSEYYLVFTKSGLVYDILTKHITKHKVSKNYRWNLNDGGLIEFISEKGNIVNKFEFKFIEGSRYLLNSKFTKIIIEKVED